jgi:hypothetical protein
MKAKQEQSKRKSSHRKKKSKTKQFVIALVVIAGLALSWIFFVRSSPDQAAMDGTEGGQVQSIVVPGLEDRMVLPATPRKPRPGTLNPAAFDDPETKAAYQAAKDSPEALENVSCYCGCFGNSGHRNSLDCFTDNHGVT